MEATYRKLRDGSWGIMVKGKASVGDVVLARRQSGQARNVKVTGIVWQGDNATICTFSDNVERGSQPAANTSRRPAQRRNWRPCGYPGCNQQYCDECDGEGAQGAYNDSSDVY